MRRALSLGIVLIAPLAVVAGVLATDRAFGAARHDQDYVVRVTLPPAGGEIGLPKIEGPLDASRPLVVIDAGHGGRDPGAGNGEIKEKALTLALAEALRDKLLAGGGVRVALTRGNDRYLFLEERSGIARRLNADVFLSIHADSAGNSEARGGTVYTLSERGSSEEAERLAASENRADAVNGVPLAKTSDSVSAILVDLAQREAGENAAELASLILREGSGTLPFRERSRQQAAFVVLKAPDVPSLLFEAGYISNPADADRLASPQGQASFADATARALRVYFARRSRLAYGAG
ncbi:MAG: N-acetylmuramoyl-L-alanine amidase [Novosphingobium sp.]|nr:N-acetylmuramoyl-L-alanine amidase [Novosphingobium sp.]